jgi:RNA polymerase sigma-70 factor (ECF subfamily)
MSTSPQRSHVFTEQLQSCQTQLMRYIFTLVRNVDDAQDVFQQTCIAMWEGFDQYDPDRSFVAWAYGVARFKSYNFLKQHRRYRARFSDEFAQRIAEAQVRPLSDAIGARQTALPGCVNQLPPSQRDLLMRCYGEGRRVAEVAASLGRSVCGVHHSLRSIREKLMECIERTVREGER